jgi:hypothetical protein
MRTSGQFGYARATTPSVTSSSLTTPANCSDRTIRGRPKNRETARAPLSAAAGVRIHQATGAPQDGDAASRDGGAHSHLELSSKTSVVVKVPSERISNIDTRRLAPCSEHRLKHGIEVIAHDLYAVHQSHFEVCVARQQTADNGSFLVERQERGQNRAAFVLESLL